VAQYAPYAQSLQVANQTAAASFDKPGTTPTPAQLALVVIQYGKGLATYNTDLGSISWPASMQTAIQVDHSQLQSLMSFLQSFSIIQPAGVSAWLVQLHGRTSSAQSADNEVRRDLGLQSTSSFP
jgi:hypothetical protein